MFNSKTLIITLFLGATIATVSCKKSNSSGSTVNADDASDAITEAVTPESSGMVAQTQNATITISTGVSTSSFECGVESDTSISGQSVSGALVSYSYLFSSSRLLTCNNGLPQQFAYNFSGKTSYDAPRISSADSTQAQFTVTGLTGPQYTFNETYVRKGSETSNVRNKNSFSSTITITTTNLVVDKSTQTILSGSASVTISGATTTGRSFSYSGTITFEGNKQEELDLGNGNKYTISWS